MVLMTPGASFTLPFNISDLWNPKPRHVLIPHHRHGMPDPIAINAHNIVTIYVLGVRRRGGFR